MRTFSLLVALCVTATAATTARPGYLVAGCPSPLRFREPGEPHKAALPPLPKDEPAANFPIPTNTMSQGATETVVSSTPEQPAVGGAAAEAGPPSVTPQMLIDYFRSGSSDTNRSATAVVPFGFVPPVGGPAPSSSATYISR